MTKRPVDQLKLAKRASIVAAILLYLGVTIFCPPGTRGPELIASPTAGEMATDISQTESFAFFRKQVVPILLTTCSARDAQGNYVCHARSSEQFARSLRDRGLKASEKTHAMPTSKAGTCTNRCHLQSGKMSFTFPVGENGEFENDRQLVLAFQKARMRARFDGPAKFARILRTPLAAQSGGLGLYHQGGEVFESTLDSDCQVLAEWVRLENETNEQAGPVSEAEIAFQHDVLPVLANNSCMSPSCHIFNHSSFLLDPGMPSADLTLPLEDRFTPEQVSFNRLTAKGFIQRLVYLEGDVEQSRILRKVVPIREGGVLHRGGNDQFFSGLDDPDYQAVKNWLRLERTEAVTPLRIDGEPVPEEQVGTVRGLVFVRTPTSNHRRYLDVGKYLPGGDLYLVKLKPGETLETASGPAVNLTARFHPNSDADVREPDVRYDGRSIVFAMRIGERDNMNIYEINLDRNLDYVDGSFRRLTYGPKTRNGILVHFTDPTFVPDPLDENAAEGGYNLDRADICFVSNEAGEVVQGVERGTVGEADAGDTKTIIDCERTEADGSFIGRRVYIVDGTNAGSWRTITGFTNRVFTKEGRSYITVDRPFDEPIDNSTIYVIEREVETQPGFLPAYSVYGIKYPLRGREQQYYDQTVTRITWNPSMDLDLSVRTTGEVFFVSQRSGCDKFGRPIFHMASCRRHLDTRFSFPTHHGNRSQFLVYADNYEMPTGIDIHVGMDPDNLWEGGTLLVSDHQFGPGLEAKNPHDFATGVFDEHGVPAHLRADSTNSRYSTWNGRGPSHTRFVFKNIPLVPLYGPHAVTSTGQSPGGIFRDTVPLPDGRVLVSHSPKPIDHLDPNARPDFDLYVLSGDPSFHPINVHENANVHKTKLVGCSAPGMSDVQAQPIYVKMKPKMHAGRRPPKEHLIRYPGRLYDTRPATYLERNYRLIDAIMRDPSPYGKSVSYATDPVTGKPVSETDQVKYLRLVEVLPMTPELAAPIDRSRIRNGDPESTVVSNGIHPMKRIAGEIPLEEDGSVVVKVPCSTPFIIQSLNGDHMALRQEARYYFFAPNETFTISPSRSETFQTCAACMGAMTGNPRDLFGPINPFAGQSRVDALAKYGDSPPEMGLDPLKRLTVDFQRDIQPILDRHCVACHQGAKAAAGLVLTGNRTAYYSDSYENLMQLEEPGSGWYGRKKYISERDGLAIESYLIEKIYGRELKAARILEGDAPHPSVKLFKQQGIEPRPLTDAERMAFVRWIDMGATFRGTDVGLPLLQTLGGDDVADASPNVREHQVNE